MDRFARHSFQFTRATHEVLFRPDPVEALDGVDRVVLMVGRNCARKYLKVKFSESSGEQNGMITSALESILANAPPEADILSLERKSVIVPAPFFHRLDWPGEPEDEDLRWMPHQILRWIKGEEMIYKFLEAHEESPFKAWLEDH